ncbi:hypothetical protein LINPERHAP1_LOCUS24802 [Linum perenne]
MTVRRSDNSRRSTGDNQTYRKLSAHPSRKVYHSSTWEATKCMTSHIMSCHVSLTRNRKEHDLRKRLEERANVCY